MESMDKYYAADLMFIWGLLGLAGVFIGLISLSDYGWMAYILTWAWLLIWVSGLHFLSNRAYPEYWATRKGPFGIFLKDGGGSG